MIPSTTKIRSSFTKNLLDTWVLQILVLTGTSVGLMFLSRRYGEYGGSVQDMTPWSIFATVFGTVYAITEGFLLASVLSRYGSLSLAIENELNAVESLRDFLVYFYPAEGAPNADVELAVAEVNRSLAVYVQHFAGNDWRRMCYGWGDEPLDSDTCPELYHIIQSIRDLPTTTDRQLIALRLLMVTAAQLCEHRTKRIALANDRLPPRLDCHRTTREAGCGG